jgi:glutamyl-tRNA(Gln) amidotransferase subunit E
MRKTVIDGSNTSGFQRTMLVAQGGNLKINSKSVGVQSICLEEDAAKLLNDTKNERNYSLDRLGIPLVEIALEPVDIENPSSIRDIALTLGRLLRTTKKVKRGIGSIRQDVNISITGSGIVEVKGVQQLDQLEKIIEFEAKRLHGLKIISEKIRLINVSKKDVLDVTNDFKSCNSKIIQNALKNGDIIKAIKLEKMSGLIGFEPYKGIRLGKEIAEVVRFFGIGGVFHSDELPNYGIEQKDVEQLRNILELNNNDGFLIIAGHNPSLEFAIEAIINRISQAKNGAPAVTRAATISGETVFLRPRPGASRMYPETDIPPIKINQNEIETARKNIPKSWEESLSEIEKKYEVNKQLAEQLFDSEYFDLFEEICKEKSNAPNFVASTLCSTITNLQRQGLDSQLLKSEEILKIFELLGEEKITKESVEIIFEQIMRGTSQSVDDVIQNMSIKIMDDKQLEEIVDKIISDNIDAVKKDGMHSLRSLMGLVMKEVRGKASGKTVNQLLTRKIKEHIS